MIKFLSFHLYHLIYISDWCRCSVYVDKRYQYGLNTSGSVWIYDGLSGTPICFSHYLWKYNFGSVNVILLHYKDTSSCILRNAIAKKLCWQINFTRACIALQVSNIMITIGIMVIKEMYCFADVASSFAENVCETKVFSSSTCSHHFKFSTRDHKFPGIGRTCEMRSTTYRESQWRQ